jgi:hypothetical protein
VSRGRYAVFVTHSRPGDYADALTAVLPQVDHVVTVAHLCRYPWSLQDSRVSVLPYGAEIPNISTAWNMGLRTVARLAQGQPYDVAVLNDDAIVPAGWFDAVVAEMRNTGAAAGSAARDFDPRMAGYAFILDGDKGLLADEQFQWWYGDDDLQRRAREAGGVVRVWGYDVEHRYGGHSTQGHFADIAAADAQRFKAKWGVTP